MRKTKTISPKQQRTIAKRFRQLIGVTGVYLIHFSRPLGHAKHYLGMAEDIASRLERHWKGKGAKLMRAVKKAKIDWRAVASWPTESIAAAEKLERSLKGNNTRNCTVCTPPGR